MSDIPDITDITNEPDHPEEPDIFPEEEEERRERRPVTARGVAVVGVRVVAGAIGIGVAAAALAASALMPLPTISATPASQLVTPVPTAQQLVCSGSILRLADDAGQGATQASAIGGPTVRYDSSSGAVDSTPLEQSDAATGGTAQAPAVISTPPNAADPTEQILLSGAQVQSVSEGDFVGLAAADCGVVTADAWLVGGSTTVGRTTLLTLSNPTEVPATVNLELFGENGAITAPGTSGIVVPASGQRVLSLAGFAPDVESPVVHVTSTGGQIVAELQQSIVRGLQPGGVDIIGATVAPSTDNVMPGLTVANAVGVEELQGGGLGFEDLRTVLRLFAPGTGTVNATISVIPEDGVGTGTSFLFEVDAGRVTELPIPELEDGSYTVRVQSDAPLVAASRVSSAQGAATDFAWVSSASTLSERAQVTVAPGPAPVMHLANAGSAPVTVSLAASTGSDLTVDVAAGATATLPVVAGTTYELTGFDALHVGVTLVDQGMIARYAAHPPGVGSSPVVVYP